MYKEFSEVADYPELQLQSFKCLLETNQTIHISIDKCNMSHKVDEHLQFIKQGNCYFMSNNMNIL